MPGVALGVSCKWTQGSPQHCKVTTATTSIPQLREWGSESYVTHRKSYTWTGQSGSSIHSLHHHATLHSQKYRTEHHIQSQTRDLPFPSMWSITNGSCRAQKRYVLSACELRGYMMWYSQGYFTDGQKLHFNCFYRLVVGKLHFIIPLLAIIISCLILFITKKCILCLQDIL